MDVIQFFTEAGQLKDYPRTGWVKRGIPNPETVAAHSWRASLLAIFMAEQEGADAGRCAIIMAAHDLPEATVGDITPSCDVSKQEKAEMEFSASQSFAAMLNSDVFHAAFLEYEGKESLEAQICTDADKLELVFTAIEYNQRHPDIPANFEPFFENARNKVVTKTGKQLLAQLESYYLDYKQGVRLNAPA